MIKHMNRRILIPLIMILFNYWGCSANSDEIPRLGLKIDPSYKIRLSEFADDIEYISLESNIPITYINNLAYDEAYIVSTVKKPLARYDLQGKLLNTYGAIGHGPQEYLYARTFAVNKSLQQVVIECQNRMLFFEITGKYLYSVDIKCRDNVRDIYFVGDNRIALFFDNTSGRAKYNWLVVDLMGNIIEEKHNSVMFSNPKNIAWSEAIITYKINDQVCYYEQFNDTVFALNCNNRVGKFVIDKQDHKFTPEWYMNYTNQAFTKGRVSNMNNYIFWPISFVETSDYFFVHYHGLDYKHNVAMCSKSDDSIVLNPKGKTGGLINDIDGGLSFIPKKCFSIKGDEYLIGWYYPYELKAHVASDAFKNSNPQYPEKKKALEKLANSLSENDNPVLMLVKLKE
ncbi:6-bladed beta-propeller [Puteibacter caeruleilacunae]|nr:6-bladed beta-propeller [Puteibacter caeruleilacunae]